MPNTNGNATTVQEHLRELQTLVQESLKQWNLATNASAATALAGQSNPGRMPNELHPLGPVLVGTLQRDFKEKIAAIRAICLSFAQGPLHQSLNGGDASTSSTFRKYSSLLKDETLLEESLSTVKASMKQCQNILRAASQDGSIKTDHLLNTIKDMATGLGLECYLETGSRPNSILPVSTLTIGGNVIVIDIDVESTGAILRVKVSYASDIHQDERVDRLLAHNLRCKCGKLSHSVQDTGKDPLDFHLTHLPECSRNFEAFSRNLKALAILDSFSKKYSDIDFFHNIRSMDIDFRGLYRQEMQLTGGNLQKVLTTGHGIPFMHAVLPGPSVAYWAPKSELSGLSWEALATAIEQGANEKVKVPFHRINIVMEESIVSGSGHVAGSGYLPLERSGFLLSEEETLTMTTVPYGSIMNDQGSVGPMTILQRPLRWVVPTTDLSVEAIYVAVLNPPVVVSEEIAKQLAALSNQAGLTTTMGSHKDMGYLSLQEMLIDHSTEQTQWRLAIDQGPGSVEQLYSFDRTKIEARLIHRIPFTHISQVYVCTKLLRQQAAFNALFQSCFKEMKPHTPANDANASISPNTNDSGHGRTSTAFTGAHGDASAIEVPILVQTPQPSRAILVSFANPFTESNVMLEILVEAGTGQAVVQMAMTPTENLTGSSSTMPLSISGPTNPASVATTAAGSGAGPSQSPEPLILTSEELTQELASHENIPMLVQWILKRSFGWMKERHQHTLKNQHHLHQHYLGRRPSSHVEDGGILKKARV